MKSILQLLPSKGVLQFFSIVTVIFIVGVCVTDFIARSPSMVQIKKISFAQVPWEEPAVFHKTPLVSVGSSSVSVEEPSALHVVSLVSQKQLVMEPATSIPLWKGQSIEEVQKLLGAPSGSISAVKPDIEQIRIRDHIQRRK